VRKGEVEEVRGKGERRRARRCEKENNELFICGYESELFAYNHSADSVEKHFLNRSKRNKTGLNIPELVRCKLLCNCWTNDYTQDQVDAGKIVQGDIERVSLSMCHCLSPNIFLSTCVHLHCKLSLIG
jgi:hypothetical protein